MSTARIVLMGEGMLELSHPAGQGTKMSYGGDVLNTAVYLARLGALPHFVTALGNDPYSDGLIKDWERECVQTGHILRDPDRVPGLYAIQTDHQGERSFYYWRSDSAARNFFNLEDHANSIAFMKEADWFFLSGITLSIYSENEREQLIDIAKAIKARGGQVAFDPNYRPKGWSNTESAKKAIEDFASHATLVLATIDDENLLFGQRSGKEHAARWLDHGVETVILKRGAQGATIYEKEVDAVKVPVAVCDRPVDTTGAGDSFNAAFLAMKVQEKSTLEATQAGNALASQVIRYPGAIIPLADMPDIDVG